MNYVGKMCTLKLIILLIVRLDIILKVIMKVTSKEIFMVEEILIIVR